MASHLPKSSRLALSLTVAVAAMALGGAVQAQGLGDVVIRCEGSTDHCGTPAGGSLRNAPEDEATDQPANDPEPAPSEPPADADEGETPLAPRPSSGEDEPGEPE